MSSEKKQKDESSLWYSGLNVLKEIISQTGFYSDDILYIARRKNDPAVKTLIHKAEKAGISIKNIPYQRLDKLTGRAPHQGIAIERKKQLNVPELSEETVFSATGFQVFVALDKLSDPHNLGAVIRSAAGFGAAGLILPKKNSPPLGATALKTSAGAMLHLPVLRTGGIASFLQQVEKKNSEIIRIGTVAEGDRAEPGWGRQFRESGRPVLLVMGDEHTGLSELAAKRCDILATLPQSSQIDSYNLSVSAGIFLYELLGGSR